MAKIIKVASAAITPKTLNPFKTTRTTTTNPFKYSNFEGNTLQFADVFEGFEPKHTNRLKMIASSVAGSMHKVRLGITEPVKRFALRIKNNITSAWDYAKNTNISDLAAVKTFNNIMNAPIEIPSIKNVGKSMAKLLNTNVTPELNFLKYDLKYLGKDTTTMWSEFISKIQHKKPTVKTSVAELERLWKEEIAKTELGGAA